jgi:transaldolase
MRDFLIDTANQSYIKDLWGSIKGDVDKKLVRGITTNPNAFFKINALHLSEWEKALPELCEIVSEIRQDDKGYVHIQAPNSMMNGEDILRYAEHVSKLNDGNTKIALKIPPFVEALRMTKQLNEIVQTNVTGISDCSTAMKCITYGVNYVSIIPGRMEEVGINAKHQIGYILQSNRSNTEIITGSMRTIEGLKWVFQYDTLPTIGERVWNLLLENRQIDEILNLDYNVDKTVSEFSPEINQLNFNLSSDFFKQMDECGKVCFEDLKSVSI